MEAPEKTPEPAAKADRYPAPNPEPLGTPQTAPPATQPATAPQAYPSYRPVTPVAEVSEYSSTYIPLDSWMYPALLRLYSLGYLDSAYIGIRPWTRLSVAHMLALTQQRLQDEPGNDEAREIYEAVLAELKPDLEVHSGKGQGHTEVESVYSRFMGISGTPLRDSFHVGETITNDYGRPYQNGFNNETGYSARAEDGRFSTYFRGEYQHAPGATGYTPAVTNFFFNQQELGFCGNLPQYACNPTSPTIPYNFAKASNFTVLEADVAVHLAGHEISFGKHDEWLGPAQGASFAWSNNAEPIYAFQFNRVEPLYIPFVSRLLGPVRYLIFIGDLKGHASPNSPWVHGEKFSFRPTCNFEFGFERTVILGGRWNGPNGPTGPPSSETHVPITFKSFIKSFFDVNDTTNAEKFSTRDPGARFSQFDVSYRLPELRKWLTFYIDSFVHDDVSPPSAPERSAYRTGLYLAQFPHAPKLDLRVEAVTTDPGVANSQNGGFLYYEVVQKEGLTNHGVVINDWIGREGKGGQAWLTYHLSPTEYIQGQYRNSKQAKDFIPNGTTQNDFSIAVVKRFHKDLELNAFVQYERWNIPFILQGTQAGVQSDTTTAVKLTWFPKIKGWD